MADSKLTALTAITEATADDIIYVVNDPTGTPVSNKITFENFQKSITQVGGTSTSLSIYFGDSVTDGSWRITISGNDLSFERRESGSWVQKGSMNP